jgi:L-aspartate oxidase
MLSDAPALAAVDPAEELKKPASPAPRQQVERIIADLESSMWAHAGLLRDHASLLQGLAQQTELGSRMAQLIADGPYTRRLGEAQSLSTVASAILRSALARTESRGAHFRDDCPQRDDANFRKHSIVTPDGAVAFEQW